MRGDRVEEDTLVKSLKKGSRRKQRVDIPGDGTYDDPADGICDDQADGMNKGYEQG